MRQLKLGLINNQTVTIAALAHLKSGAISKSSRNSCEGGSGSPCLIQLLINANKIKLTIYFTISQIKSQNPKSLIKTLHNRLQMQVFPFQDFIFCLNSASVLESLISVGNEDHKCICTEYSLFFMPLSLLLVTANYFHFANCIKYFSL